MTNKNLYLMSGNENCLAIIVKGTPGFNDVVCHHRKPVICQQ